MNSRTNYKLQTLQRMARKGSDWLDLSDKWRNSNLVQGLVDETWLTHARVCVCEHIARGHDDGGIVLTLPPDLDHD